MILPHNKTRACVKSPEVNFGNDQICDMADFDEKSRWIGWSKNEFSHSLSLETTAVVVLGWPGTRGLPEVASRRCLSFFR